MSTRSQAIATDTPEPPPTAIRAVRQAERLADRGQIEKALVSLDKALVLGADPYDCYMRQARLYQSLGRQGQALSATEKAIREKPGHVSARETMVALLLESRDYERAAEASRALLRISPRHTAARDALGAAYMGMGNVEAAMRVANDLIRLHPHDPIHRFKKALLCQHQGELRLALAEFERVLTMTEDDTLAQATREHMDALDVAQLHSILLLSAEDPLFRAKVIREPERAIMERGFALSELGVRQLYSLASEELADYPGERRPRLYN